MKTPSLISYYMSSVICRLCTYTCFSLIQFILQLLEPLNNLIDFCFVYSLFETIQTLFWAAFGLVDLDNFELAGIKSFTRFWGMLMFGCYSVISIVVLLNLLIAMMNHSYQLISVSNIHIFFSHLQDIGIRYNIISRVSLFQYSFSYVC